MPTMQNIAVDSNTAHNPPPNPIFKININVHNNAKKQHDSVQSITTLNTIQTKKKKSLAQRRLDGLCNPPCPKCPEKPRSPHSDWTVIKLPLPKCVKKNGDENLVWVFYFYVNNRTHETQWFPPPPLESDGDESEEEDDDCLEVVNKLTEPSPSITLDKFFVRPPVEEAYEREMNGEEEPEPESEVEFEPEEKELTKYEKTFTQEKTQKLYMNPNSSQVDENGKLLSFPERAREAGVDIIDPQTGKVYLKNKLAKAVRDFFILEVHEGDVQSYYQSFKGKSQEIDRERVENIAEKRKREQVQKADGRMKIKAKKLKVSPMTNDVSNICMSNTCHCLSTSLFTILFPLLSLFSKSSTNSVTNLLTPTTHRSSANVMDFFALARHCFCSTDISLGKNTRSMLRRRRRGH